MYLGGKIIISDSIETLKLIEMSKYKQLNLKDMLSRKSLRLPSSQQPLTSIEQPSAETSNASSSSSLVITKEQINLEIEPDSSSMPLMAIDSSTMNEMLVPLSETDIGLFLNVKLHENNSNKFYEVLTNPWIPPHH
ncbi:unnamed protein product [Didymodactylos carnosus]|uniref:Uncharacterized protein n=1 Tax=Didymodactylos carnosus TaxID=1234261 RepID=A0A814RU27_9BILA|nr:unnamed protein product [Didymodactylos carnosus]CAF3901691.1 unnamed protein product [Didymodactylos carnosus]